MLKTNYKHLNNIQKGSFAEAYAKMAFTLEGFEVYTTDYDDRGIDFIVRAPVGDRYLRVQVKSTDGSANPFVYSEKFEETPEFLVCAVRLVEGQVPQVYLARGTDWKQEMDCLHFNPEGGRAGAYYEFRFARKYSESMERHKFENYVEQLRKSHPIAQQSDSDNT